MHGEEALLMQRRFTMYGKETLLIQERFTMYGKETLLKILVFARIFLLGENMIEKGLYYAKNEFYELIRNVGGQWNDGKHRPLVCLIESTEQRGLYWAIPMGKLNHRNTDGQSRISSFLQLPESDLRSCYYHIGRTTSQSIFFISDAVPIIDDYISEQHVGADKKHFIIKNPNLTSELQRKLKRILAIENSKNNTFRQHITDIKNVLINKLSEKYTDTVEVAAAKEEISTK